MATKKKKPGDYMRELPPEERKLMAASGGKALVARHGAEYMRELGKKGGAKSTSEHMRRIGRLGGLAAKRPKSTPDKKP